MEGGKFHGVLLRDYANSSTSRLVSQACTPTLTPPAFAPFGSGLASEKHHGLAQKTNCPRLHVSRGTSRPSEDCTFAAEIPVEIDDYERNSWEPPKLIVAVEFDYWGPNAEKTWTEIGYSRGFQIVQVSGIPRWRRRTSE
jgi:hypothetical protein